MSNDNVFKLIQPGAFDDQLTEILRQGARTLLAQAVEAEVADFLTKHADLKTEDGRRRLQIGTPGRLKSESACRSSFFSHDEPGESELVR